MGRSLPHQRGSTLYGLEDPSWLHSPPSNRCGSANRNMTNPAHQLSTESASKKPSSFFLCHFCSFQIENRNTLAGRNWQLINTLLDCAFSTVTSILKIILIVFNKPAFVPSIYRRPIY